MSEKTTFLNISNKNLQGQDIPLSETTLRTQCPNCGEMSDIGVSLKVSAQELADAIDQRANELED